MLIEAVKGSGNTSQAKSKALVHVEGAHADDGVNPSDAQEEQ